LLAGAPGVTAVEPLQHRLAYVGPDLQDLYGINPTSIAKVAPMRDSFVPHSTIHAALASLSAHPDGVLLSAETLKDYQLNPGDSIQLRLQVAPTGQYKAIPFRVAGQVSEFPTAPKDSFIVANAAYIAKTTGSDAIGTFLIASSSPTTTARMLLRQVGNQLPAGVQVTDISTARQNVTSASGLAATDLAGLARLELGFGLIMALASGGLALGLGINERRRALVLLAALGATTRQRGRFLAAESRSLLGWGLAGGALIAGLIAYLLIKVLTGIFDPPPTGMSLPGWYLAALGGTVTAGTVAVRIVFGRLAARAGPSQLRDL
jgi:putative ABC transport system permease protein